MPLYKVTPRKDHRADEIDALIALILAIGAAPVAAWILAAILNAALF